MQGARVFLHHHFTTKLSQKVRALHWLQLKMFLSSLVLVRTLIARLQAIEVSSK